MRDLPRLCLIIKHPKGYLMQKIVNELTLPKLAYEPYTDDIDSVIFQFLYKAVGATKIDCTDIGILNFKDERIRIVVVKINELRPLYSNCPVSTFPEGLKALNFTEMDYLISKSESMEDYTAWNKYKELVSSLQAKLNKLK